MIRGGCAFRIWPNVLVLIAIELPVVMFAAPAAPLTGVVTDGMKLFNTLNASARTSNRCRSRMLKARDSAKSNCHRFGPTRLFQPTFPNVPGEGTANAAGSTHCA